MTTVQPIYYTARTAAWAQFAADLGLAAARAPLHEWTEFVGDGVLAVHGVVVDDSLDKTTDLNVLVADLDAADERLRRLGIAAVRETLTGLGDVLIVTAASGQRISVTSAEAPRPAGEPTMTVMPIWYQADLAEPLAILEALGLQRRISSLNGSWIDLTADDGGLVGLHSGRDTGISLSCEYRGDLDELLERLMSAGYSASVVDEAYNRTLLVTTPDGWDLWVNGVIDDLYGYRSGR